jgi:hypothetical protein
MTAMRVKNTLFIVLLLLIGWVTFDMSGQGFALSASPMAGDSTGVPVCRYLTARGLVDQPAFGLNPSCGAMGEG